MPFFYFMNSFKSIQSVGRQGLIDLIKSKLTFSSGNSILDIGDDAAVLSTDDGKLTLLTSETFVEGVDFDLTYSPLNHLGYKLLSAALSDIYAMNGSPEAALINISLPNKFSTQMIELFYEGIDSACNVHHTEIVGGDLNPSHGNFIVSITVYGKAEAENLVKRSGAAKEDAICVTGDLGGALAGLRILMREKKYWDEYSSEAVQPDLSEYEFVVRRQLVPEARNDLIKAFSKHGIVPSSMIDITQGLAHELMELTKSSSVGAYIYEAALPIALETRKVADEMKEEVDRYAFFGGEDLELLFTLPKNELESFHETFPDFTVIGKIAPESEGIQVQTAEGDVKTLDEIS